MPIKAVLIDLDNTLYEYEKCNTAGLDAVFDKLSSIFDMPKEAVKETFDQSRKLVKQWLKDTSASHSRFLYFQKTIERLKGSTDIKLTQDIHDLFWKNYFSQMTLFDGVIDFFEYLKNVGIKIAIVSDLLADIQFKKITELDIDKYIDFVVTSEEAGRDKPAESVFLLALEKLGLSKNEVVLIGDDLDKDAKGARDFGIRYIQVNNGDFKDVMESFKKLNSL